MFVNKDKSVYSPVYLLLSHVSQLSHGWLSVCLSCCCCHGPIMRFRSGSPLLYLISTSWPSDAQAFLLVAAALLAASTKSRCDAPRRSSESSSSSSVYLIRIPSLSSKTTLLGASLRVLCLLL